MVRIAVILLAAACGVSIIAYLLTGDRRYRQFSLRLFKVSLLAVLLLLGLLFFERLARFL